MAYVQRAGNPVDSASSTTVSALFASNVTAGSLIVGIVTWDIGGTLTSVGDGTRTFTLVGSRVDDTGSGTSVQAFYYLNHPGGSTTVTATFNAATAYRGILFAEYSGGLTTYRTAAANIQNTPGTGTDAITSTAMTVVSGDTLIGFTQGVSTGSIVASAGTGWTNRDATGISNDFQLEDRAASGASHAATFTQATAEYRITFGLAFYASSGAAALAGDATAVAAAAAQLTTAIQAASDAASVATGGGALTTAIQTAGDAQSIATAAADLSTAIQLAGAAQNVSTAAAGLVSWVNVTVASPYAGPGSIFDDRYWTGAPPTDGDLIAYEDRGDGFAIAPDGTYSAPVFGSWLVQYFNGTWSLSEVSLVQSDFSSNASAQSTSTGDLLTAIQMAAAAAAVATVAAALDTGIPLGGDAQVVATAAGDLLTAIQLSGDAQSISTASADLYGAAQLAGDALAQSTSAGDLSTVIALLGAAQSIAAAVGDITTMIQLSGDVQAQAVASGSLDAVAAQLQGDAQAVATAQADLSTDIPLAGDATAISVAVGAIDTAINLLGAASGVASADGQLVGSAADLVGAADAIATALADLTTISFISGDAQGSAIAQGSIDVLGPIFANAAAIATAAADLSSAIRMFSDAVSVATAGGDITTLGPVVYPPRGRAAFGRRGAGYGSRRPPVLH